MTEPKSPDDLLHREIDGENGPAESAELQRQIAADPALRGRSENMLGLSHALASVGQEDPPPGLIADVMRTIRAKGALVTGGWVETWRSAFGRRPGLSYALSMAAGIVLGAVGIGALGPSALHTRDQAAAGTILPPGRLGSFHAIDRTELAAEGIHGEAATRRGDATVAAELSLDSRQPLHLTLEFDPNVFSPLGFGRSVAAQGEVVIEPDRVRIAHSGSGTYQVFLGVKGTAPAPLVVRVAGEGVEIERKLDTGGGRLAAN